MLQTFAEQILFVASLQNLMVLAGSVLVGMIFGALPGLTATLAVALLSTVTFNLSTELAMFALIGAYVGAIYGPAHSAILLGIPGTAAGAATALDGHILAQKGQGGEAIATATIASVVGTVFGLCAMILVSPLLIDMALLFTSVEFFLLAIFGVLICGSLTAPDMPAKGWISGILGLMLASVGIETIQGYQRFTFGIPELAGGVEVVPVILGAFAIPQIIRVLRDREVASGARPAIGSLRPRFGFLWRNKGGVLRSGCIGVGVGTIPGVGEDIASWASYDSGKKLDAEPESFGKGNIKGVICAETANNACIGGAIIPVLTLGVPGSPPAAMLLWASGFILVLGLLMARASVQVLRLPVEVLMPLVAFLAVLGSYALGLNVFNVYMMFLFGVVVYLLEELGYPVAPAVIGVLLGTMADFSIRRALLGSEGSLEPFVTRPVALILLGLIVFSLALQSRFLKEAFRRVFSKRRATRNGTA